MLCHSSCSLEIHIEVKEYSDDLVRGLLEKITVKADSLVIEFKSGTEIEIEA